MSGFRHRYFIKVSHQSQHTTLQSKQTQTNTTPIFNFRNWCTGIREIPIKAYLENLTLYCFALSFVLVIYFTVFPVWIKKNSLWPHIWGSRTGQAELAGWGFVEMVRSTTPFLCRYPHPCCTGCELLRTALPLAVRIQKRQTYPGPSCLGSCNACSKSVPLLGLSFPIYKMRELD